MVGGEDFSRQSIRICFQKTEEEKLDLGFPFRALVYVNIYISFSILGDT